MDAEREIRAFIKPAAWLTLVMCALLVVLLASTVCFLACRGTLPLLDEKADAMPFHPLTSPKGGYAYLDVVEVSDWLYDLDNQVYYSAADADGYLYTVRLYRSQHDEMEEQRAYWEHADSDTPLPAPYRLYGLVETATGSVRKYVARSWDITEDEYEQYFGTLLLNATTSPAEERSWMFMLVMLFSFLGAAVFLAISGSGKRYTRRCLRRLEELGLAEQAAAELDAALAGQQTGASDCLDGGKVLLTEHYLFVRRAGVAVPYTDILWCHLQIQQHTLGLATTFLNLYTATVKGTTLHVPGRRNEESIRQYVDTIVARIRIHNPELLVGFTPENKRLYRERARAARR